MFERGFTCLGLLQNKKIWKENSLQYMVNNKAQKVYLINLNFKGHYRSLI